MSPEPTLREMLMRSGARLVILGLALALTAPGAGLAGDGLIEINQARALAGGVTPGDAPGYPVEIFTRGSFRLTGDLTAPGTAAAAITVYAGGTRIDLNGFSISSATQCPGTPPVCSPTGTGIGIDASGATDVSVRNGRIAGFGVYGVSLFDASRAEQLTVESNGQGGIVAADACVIAESVVYRNGGAGISAGAGSRVVENTVNGNAGPGIDAPVSALALRNTVTQNAAAISAGHRNRLFYLTPTGVMGDAARGACAPGFHMASLWEIHDPTQLTYDRSRGHAGVGGSHADLGLGPPNNLAGWIRTGFPGTTGSAPTARGQMSCSGWSSTSGAGSTAALESLWSSPQGTWPWVFNASSCASTVPVWCVAD